VDKSSRGSLLIAPAVASLSADLSTALAEADAILFDGTFWSDDELRNIDPAARSAQQMGHLPISDGSLEFLRPLGAAHKIYVHINNTNPILAAQSDERMAVETAGIVVGYDGLEFHV
jgi:pyrroloquinoline quinone biosynthesis protein B